MLQPYLLNLQSGEIRDPIDLFAPNFDIPVLQNYPNEKICTFVKFWYNIEDLKFRKC